MTDHDLKLAAMRELERDPLIDATAIGVAVHSGVVTLTGVVDCWTAKHRANAAVHHVGALLHVANDIAISSRENLASANEGIAHRVRGLLEQEFPTAAPHIRCTVQAGDIVTLVGTVPTAEDRAKIVQAVSRVHGVKLVEPKLALALA